MPDDESIIDIRAGDDLTPLAGSWDVDPTHSSLEFVSRYAVFTLVRGRFTSFCGTVVIDIDPPHPAATQIDVDIDASSVDTASRRPGWRRTRSEIASCNSIRASAAPRQKWMP